MPDLLDLLPPQFELPPAAHAGVDQAEAATDAWWRGCAETAIAYFASTGMDFGAEQLLDLGLPAPKHHNMIGAAFRRAAVAGVIVPVGVRPSTTPSRRGGLTRVWRGVAA